MKLTVIGFGQCGGRIADKFTLLDRKAKRQRNIEIIPSAFAVNTDAADLSGLRYMPRDFTHRILVGEGITHGHGVGKMNEMAVRIVRKDADRIFHALRSVGHALESDAFLLISSSSGGTGSGSISVMASILKERFLRRPVYALLTLPFEHEQLAQERAVYNTGRCLKTLSSVVDAVILVDNQRYIGKGLSMNKNLDEINDLIVEPFYDLLCSGEERSSRYVGAKTMDSGDIIATVQGWTVMGSGQSDLSVFRMPFASPNFRKRNDVDEKGLTSLDQALADLSCECQLNDVGSALYLINGPASELNTELDTKVGDYLRELMPNATIRNGDYPSGRSTLSINLIISNLNNLEVVRDYYRRSSALMTESQNRVLDNQVKLQDMEEEGKSLPYLL